MPKKTKPRPKPQKPISTADSGGTGNGPTKPPK